MSPTATAERVLLQNARLSFVFGMLLGDFGRDGAAVIGVRTVLQSSYWRETEAAAHAYGARLVQKTAADPRVVGAMLRRVAGIPGASILLTHPEATGRAIAIGAPAGEAANAAGLLTPAESMGLKNICRTTTHPAGCKP